MNPSIIKVFAIFVLTFLVSCRSQYKTANYSCGVTSCSFNLTYTGKDEYYEAPKNAIIKTLKVVFEALTFSDFTIKITDLNRKRFEVPQGNGFPEDPYRNFSFPLAAAGYTFTYTLEPFDFRISRKSSNYTIFSSYDQDIIYSDYYIQIGTQIQNDFIYGLGERFSSSFRVKNGKWTMFNKDHPFEIDHGTGQQTYGYYPYYLNREKDNYFHLTYFRSSNAMDVIKEPVNGKTSLTFKVVGGVIDLRFFLGDINDPVETLQRMTSYAGYSSLPPFWALGFHQCRWGYENSSQLLEVLATYQSNGIPLDTIWSDIDYMLDFQDFTIDEEHFPLSDMSKILENYRYVPIIDAGIKISGIAYDEGIKRNVFINDAVGQPFVGNVWPGDTTFVDFFHPNATKYWGDMLNLLYEKVKFDGVWLDMNELANFCNGPCTMPKTQTIFDYTHDIPYHPGSSNIEDGTISLNCTHYQGIKEADVHVYNALLQNKATSDFLQGKKVRPFIISRSSTIGSSRYGNHWTGDNSATWQFLQGSISNIFNSHLNGFKIVGQDICGFGGDTTVQLCARWFQLGALYPFARNHNAYGSLPQEPYALGEIVLKTATKAIKLRYSLLKYLYTFILISDYSHIWTPLFFMFPKDENTYADEIADTTFLLTDYILVAPILEEGKTSRSVYLPHYNWVDLFSGKKYLGNQTYVIQNDLTDIIPIFIAEGFSLLLQDAEKIRSTKDLTNKFSIYSAFAFAQTIGEKTYYRSSGIILPFNDYQNDTAIDICKKSTNCYYVISLFLIIESNRKTLSVRTLYKGPTSLNDQLLIEKLNIYYEDKVIRFKPEKSIVISKNDEQTIIILEEKSEVAKELLNLQLQ